MAFFTDQNREEDEDGVKTPSMGSFSSPGMSSSTAAPSQVKVKPEQGGFAGLK